MLFAAFLFGPELVQMDSADYIYYIESTEKPSNSCLDWTKGGQCQYWHQPQSIYFLIKKEQTK